MWQLCGLSGHGDRPGLAERLVNGRHTNAGIAVQHDEGGGEAREGGGESGRSTIVA